MAAPASDSPRLRVAAALLLDGRFVLVRHTKGAQSYLLLPGGGVEAGESLQEALVREVREETGLRIEPGPLLFVNDAIDPAGGRHVVHLTFSARVGGGEISREPLDPRVTKVVAASAEELTSLPLRPPIAAELLRAAIASFEVPARYLGPLWTDAVEP